MAAKASSTAAETRKYIEIRAGRTTIVTLAALALAAAMVWAALAVRSPPPPIKLLFCDGGHEFTGFWPAMQAAVAPRALEMVTPPADPDVVIFSLEGNAHRAYPAARRVLIVGEPHFDPSLMQWANLTIHCARDVPGTEYFPLWATGFGERRENVSQDLIKVPAHVEAALAQKHEFCAILHTSPALKRNVFDPISAYKPVTVVGWQSNTSDHEVCEDGNCRVISANEKLSDLAVHDYVPFRFVIVAEEGRHTGYITEEIVNVMLAHAIPIYIGAPDIAEHFHPGSFIDAGNMTAKALLMEIARLDQNGTAYREMLLRPWLHLNKLPAFFDIETQAAMLRRGVVPPPHNFG